MRGDYLPRDRRYLLDLACCPISKAFGFGCYQVGSSLEHKDYRDVDVRCILADDEFERMFPGCDGDGDWQNPGWAIICAGISRLLSEASGLPVDFQFQKQSVANEKHDGKRNGIGLNLLQTATETRKEP